MKVRNARKSDLNKILDIYNSAKEYMRSNGNLTQWNSNYPLKELLLSDINNKNLYVIYEKDNIYGVFMFNIGIDETYINIHSGKWLNEEVYGTIHRIASSGEKRGILSITLDYCKKRVSNIRIDTHKDNHIMNNLLLKNGFFYCGIIHLSDGSERLAYQYTYI